MKCSSTCPKLQSQDLWNAVAINDNIKGKVLTRMVNDFVLSSGNKDMSFSEDDFKNALLLGLLDQMTDSDGVREANAVLAARDERCKGRQSMGLVDDCGSAWFESK